MTLSTEKPLQTGKTITSPGCISYIKRSMEPATLPIALSPSYQLDSLKTSLIFVLRCEGSSLSQFFKPSRTDQPITARLSFNAISVYHFYHSSSRIDR